jgi:hypothetical protein
MKLSERVIDLGARITALRSEIDSKRAELAGMERELDSILSGQPVPLDIIPRTSPPPEPLPSIQVAIQNSYYASIADRISQLLLARPGQEFDAPQIYSMLADASLNLPSIRAALSRLVDGTVIERSKRGFYRAKTMT